ncbi:MAG: hypothetical protein IPJ65_03240 [Archangiaceae bacterium]|nr:hypothetical protein [Archangiaceae bacterium]
MSTTSNVTSAKGTAAAKTPAKETKKVSPEELMEQLKKMLEAEIDAATDKSGKVDLEKLGPLFHDALEDKSLGWSSEKPKKAELLAKATGLAQAHLDAVNQPVGKRGHDNVTQKEVKAVGKGHKAAAEYLATALLAAGGTHVPGITPDAAHRGNTVSGANVLAKARAQITTDAKAGGKTQLFDEAREELAKKGNKKPSEAELIEEAVSLVERRLPRGDLSADQIASVGAKDSHVAPYIDAGFVGAGGQKKALTQAKADLDAPPPTGDGVEVKADTKVAAAKRTAAAGKVAEEQQAVSKAQRGDVVGKVGAHELHPDVDHVLKSAGTAISGSEMNMLLNVAYENGVHPNDIADQLIRGDGPIGKRLSLEGGKGKQIVTLDALHELTGVLQEHGLPEGATPSQTKKHGERISSLQHMLEDPSKLTAIDPEGNDQLFRLRVLVGKGGVLTKAAEAELPDESLVKLAAQQLRGEGVKRITPQALDRKLTEMHAAANASAIDPAVLAGAGEAGAAVNGEPPFTPIEMQYLQGIEDPNERARAMLEMHLKKEATAGRLKLGDNGEPFTKTEAELLSQIQDPQERQQRMLQMVMQKQEAGLLDAEGHPTEAGLAASKAPAQPGAVEFTPEEIEQLRSIPDPVQQQRLMQQLAAQKAAANGTRMPPHEVNQKIEEMVDELGIAPGAFIQPDQMDQFIAMAGMRGVTPEDIADHLIATTVPSSGPVAGLGGGAMGAAANIPGQGTAPGAPAQTQYAAQLGEPAHPGQYSSLGAHMSSQALDRLKSRLSTQAPRTQEEAQEKLARNDGLMKLRTNAFGGDPMLAIQAGNLPPQQRALFDRMVAQQMQSQGMNDQAFQAMSMQSMGMGPMFQMMAMGGFPMMGFDPTTASAEMTAMGAGVWPSGNASFDLARAITNYPPFSPAEMELLGQIKDPQQRALQMLQMYMQKQALMATVITNLAQMRHDMLKAVAQNLRS